MMKRVQFTAKLVCKISSREFLDVRLGSCVDWLSEHLGFADVADCVLEDIEMPVFKMPIRISLISILRLSVKLVSSDLCQLWQPEDTDMYL